MELDADSIRTLNRLDPHAKHCLRYRASQLTVMREVEMRLCPSNPPEKMLKIFQDEGRELSLLDSPWFLPVLEAGTFQDRPFYLVPLRRYPTLGEALEDSRFGIQERFWAVRHLAGMMASLHDVHGALGPPYLDLLAWNWDENMLVCLHHKHLPRPQPAWLTGDLPEDMQSGSKWSARTDLFLWGFFAYWLLAEGSSPFPDLPGVLEPIRKVRPDLSPDLALAIEACLAWDLEDRPRDAVELRSALQQSPTNQVVPSVPVEVEPATDLSASQVSRRSSLAFKARVDELREEGRVPEAGELSLVESFVAVGLQTATHLVQGTGEDGERRVRWGAMLLSLALVAGVGWLALPYLQGPRALRPRRAPATRPPPTRPPTPPPPPRSGVLLAPSQQARLLREPLVRSIVELPPVTPENFDEAWKVLRKVVLAGKLPRGLIEAETLVELRRRKALDPADSARRMQARLEEIRKVLGVDDSTGP